MDCAYSLCSTAAYLCSLSINFRVGFVMQVDDDNNDEFGSVLSDFDDDGMLDE